MRTGNSLTQTFFLLGEGGEIAATQDKTWHFTHFEVDCQSQEQKPCATHASSGAGTPQPASHTMGDNLQNYATDSLRSRFPVVTKLCEA